MLASFENFAVSSHCLFASMSVEISIPGYEKKIHSFISILNWVILFLAAGLYKIFFVVPKPYLFPGWSRLSPYKKPISLTMISYFFQSMCGIHSMS